MEEILKQGQGPMPGGEANAPMDGGVDSMARNNTPTPPVGAMGAQENDLLTDEQKRNMLENSLEDVERKNEAISSKAGLNKDRIKEAKIAILNELFASMAEMGVDPNSLESINEFLTKLEEQDPDLRRLFEITINSLTPEEEEMEEEGAMPEGISGAIPEAMTDGPMSGAMPGAVPGAIQEGMARAMPGSMPEEGIPGEAGDLTDKFSNLQNQIMR